MARRFRWATSTCELGNRCCGEAARARPWSWDLRKAVSCTRGCLTDRCLWVMPGSAMPRLAPSTIGSRRDPWWKRAKKPMPKRKKWHTTGPFDHPSAPPSRGSVIRPGWARPSMPLSWRGSKIRAFSRPRRQTAPPCSAASTSTSSDCRHPRTSSVLFWRINRRKLMKKWWRTYSPARVTAKDGHATG